MKIIVNKSIINEYYDQYLSGDEKGMNPYYFSGRSIDWFGKDNMCVFHKSIVEYMPENMWNGEKLEYLEDLIDNSEDKIQLTCDYATINIITVQDIIEHQEAVLTDEFEVNFDGIEEPESSGDDELDLYLGATDEDMFEEHLEGMGLDGLGFLNEPDRIIKSIIQTKGSINIKNLWNNYTSSMLEDYEEKGYEENHFKWIKEALNKLKELDNQYNDLKKYKDLNVVIRDGNHRIKAAINSGEQWLCANIDEDDLKQFSSEISESRYINQVTQKYK